MVGYPYYQYENERFAINKYPKNIWVKDRDTLLKNIYISSTEITIIATRVNAGPDTTGGTLSGLNVHFFKEGLKMPGGSHFDLPTNALKGATYTAKRNAVTLGADEVSFEPR